MSFIMCDTLEAQKKHDQIKNPTNRIFTRFVGGTVSTGTRQNHLRIKQICLGVFMD